MLMPEHLSLAYSPCPNDTYVYASLALGEQTLPDVRFSTYLHDVETLNRYALEGHYDITKVSCQTYLNIRQHYRLLDVGAAIGYGCGPMVIARQPHSLENLKHCKIVFPGELTTAYSLFRMMAADSGQHIFATYDDIIPMIMRGDVDCGVIIHESRFTYRQSGLHCLIDLGAWWEQETGLPLPLGCAVIKHELYDSYAQPFEALVRECLNSSGKTNEVCSNYIHHHAQEMQPSVIQSHIDLYVNEFTVSLGVEGINAIQMLEQRLIQVGMLQ